MSALVSQRLRHSIHIDGPLPYLEIGQEYPVDAVERREGGLWYFIGLPFNNDYPYPYPVELFEIVDDEMPTGWCMRLEDDVEHVEVRRLTFKEWAHDDEFYEKLVDGDPVNRASYLRSRKRP